MDGAAFGDLNFGRLSVQERLCDRNKRSGLSRSARLHLMTFLAVQDPEKKTDLIVAACISHDQCFGPWTLTAAPLRQLWL